MDAVGSRLVVIVDGGVRRGADVVKALATQSGARPSTTTLAPRQVRPARGR